VFLILIFISGTQVWTKPQLRLYEVKGGPRVVNAFTWVPHDPTNEQHLTAAWVIKQDCIHLLNDFDAFVSKSVTALKH